MLAQKITFFISNYYTFYITFILFQNSKTSETSIEEWTEVKLDEIEDWNKVGEASISKEINGNITLKFETTSSESIGAIWHKYNFSKKTGLIISFQPMIIPEVGGGLLSSTKYPEGFAIVFTSSPTDNLIGEKASGIGYNGIKNAVVFEFDFNSQIHHLDSLKPHFSVHYKINGEVSSNSLLCISLCNKNLPNFYDSTSKDYLENTVFEISIIGNVLNVKANNDEFLLKNEDLTEFQQLVKEEEVHFGVTAGLIKNTKVIINNLKIFETSSIIENISPNCNILNYLSLKCIKNKVNSVFKETFIDNIFDELQNKSFSTLLEEVINEKKNDITTIINNTIYQITSSFNQISKIYESISTLNLNLCENKLKDMNIIDKNDTLLIFKIDYFLRKIPFVKYEIFHPITKNLLNLSLCNSIKVNISYKIDIDDENIFKYDPLNEFYHDLCFPYTSESGTDMTLYDRKNDFNNNNLTLCTIDCEFKEYNSSTKKVICECNIDNKSFEIKQEKRELPYELSNIIDKREKKFKRINDTYQSLKKENDTFLSYWHYTQKIKEKLEKKSFQENELEKEEENDEYKKISKQYQFSNRDMIEMELQKNLTTKIFKSNPLIINNDNEMFFHFLKETNKSPYKSVNFNEQNSSRYLIKIKDFLEYISILKDENIDSLNKKIKLSNCNYTQNQEKKIEEEKIRILEEQQKTEKKEISESKDMIKDINNLLNILNENKDYLEDPKYFSFYRNTDRKSFTPNKKIQQHLMNNSTKSDFFIGDKNHFLRKDKYDTMRILKLKKQNLSKQLNSLLNESNNKKSKRIKKLRINNINPLVDKFGNESYSKENNYSTMNMNFFNSKISNINNNSTNSLYIQKYDNKKILPSIKNYYPYNAFTKSSISNNMQQPISLEENKNLNKKRESFNLDNTSKELNLNLNLNDETDNDSESSIKSNDNQKNNEENKESDLKDACRSCR